jgi:hypothetical protein
LNNKGLFSGNRGPALETLEVISLRLKTDGDAEEFKARP